MFNSPHMGIPSARLGKDLQVKFESTAIDVKIKGAADSLVKVIIIVYFNGIPEH